MLTTNPFDDDKLREECGIFGVYNSEGAAAMAALGLHALQHRGQEAAGISQYSAPQEPGRAVRRRNYSSRKGLLRRSKETILP